MIGIYEFDLDLRSRSDDSPVGRSFKAGCTVSVFHASRSDAMRSPTVGYGIVFTVAIAFVATRLPTITLIRNPALKRRSTCKCRDATPTSRTF